MRNIRCTAKAMSMVVIMFMGITALNQSPIIAQCDEYWAKSYGGIEREDLRSLNPTSDGGCVLAGASHSFGSGEYEYWIVKLDCLGDIEWQKIYDTGPSDHAIPTCILQKYNGQYIVAGLRFINTPGIYADYWVMKLNTDGEVVQQKAYNGDLDEGAASVDTIPGGGFLVGGWSRSFSGGGEDIWVARLAGNLSYEWGHYFDGGSIEYGGYVQAINEDAYVVAGTTPAWGAGSYDFWVIKVGKDGGLYQIKWQYTYGGSGNDRPRCLERATLDGFIVAGFTDSPEFVSGGTACWVLKIASDGHIQWQKVYEGFQFSGAHSIQQTSDGGYILGGDTGANGGGYLVLKLDSDGRIEWQKMYRAIDNNGYGQVKEATQGGYIVAGGSYGNFEVFKTESTGDIAAECNLVTDPSVSGTHTNAVATASMIDLGISGSVTQINCDSITTVINTNCDVYSHCPGQGDFPTGPDDDVTPSLGSFGIWINPKFQSMVNGCPGYDSGTNEWHSVTLSDPSTVIGRSNPHSDGGALDTNGTPVGTVGTIISDASMPLWPDEFEGPAGTREVHTEVYYLQASGSGFSIRAGTAAPDRPVSPGEVESRLEGNDFPAESFFDVYVEVDLPACGTFTGATLYNHTPLVVTNEYLSNPPGFPPHVVYTLGNSVAIPMLFKEDDPGGNWSAGETFGHLTLFGWAPSFGVGDITEFEAIMETVLETPLPWDIPTLTSYGMAALLLILVAAGLFMMRRKRRAASDLPISL